MQPQICRLSVRYLTPFACSAHFPPAEKSSWHATPRTPCAAQRNAATVCAAQRNENSARYDYGEATSQSERMSPDIPDPSEYTYKYYATCAPGLEELVAAELSSPLIGARDVEVGSSGVGFSGPLATGYRQAHALSQALHLPQYCPAANENECVTSGKLNLSTRAGATSPLTSAVALKNPFICRLPTILLPPIWYGHRHSVPSRSCGCVQGQPVAPLRRPSLGPAVSSQLEHLAVGWRLHLLIHSKRSSVARPHRSSPKSSPRFQSQF